MQWSISVDTGWTLGPLRKDMRNRIARAGARATDKAAQGVRDDLRTSMRSARLGGLANTVAATSDLRRGRPTGRSSEGVDVAAFVVLRGLKSKRTAGALDAYVDNDSTDIAPVRGRWLAIATREIPARAGRKRMTPELYKSSGLESRIGPLKLVPGKHPGTALLVVEDVTINLAREGKARRSPKNGRARAGRARVGIVAFVLIRQTRRSRRVDPQAIAARWQQRLPRMLSDEMTKGPGSNPFVSRSSFSFTV
jgi:hypothetical protein